MVAGNGSPENQQGNVVVSESGDASIIRASKREADAVQLSLQPPRTNDRDRRSSSLCDDTKDCMKLAKLDDTQTKEPACTLDTKLDTRAKRRLRIAQLKTEQGRLKIDNARLHQDNAMLKNEACALHKHMLHLQHIHSEQQRHHGHFGIANPTALVPGSLQYTMCSPPPFLPSAWMSRAAAPLPLIDAATGRIIGTMPVPVTIATPSLQPVFLVPWQVPTMPFPPPPPPPLPSALMPPHHGQLLMASSSRGMMGATVAAAAAAAPPFHDMTGTIASTGETDMVLPGQLPVTKDGDGGGGPFHR